MSTVQTRLLSLAPIDSTQLTTALGAISVKGCGDYSDDLAAAKDAIGKLLALPGYCESLFQKSLKTQPVPPVTDWAINEARSQFYQGIPDYPYRRPNDANDKPRSLSARVDVLSQRAVDALGNVRDSLQSETDLETTAAGVLMDAPLEFQQRVVMIEQSIESRGLQDIERELAAALLKRDTVAALAYAIASERVALGEMKTIAILKSGPFELKKATAYSPSQRAALAILTRVMQFRYDHRDPALIAAVDAYDKLEALAEGVMGGAISELRRVPNDLYPAVKTGPVYKPSDILTMNELDMKAYRMTTGYRW